MTTQQTVIVKTSNHSLSVNEVSGAYVFTNEGAGALVIFTLPSALASQKVRFIIQNANGIQINAGVGDTINGSASISSTNVWDIIDLYCINTTEWIASIINQNSNSNSNQPGSSVFLRNWNPKYRSNNNSYYVETSTDAAPNQKIILRRYDWTTPHLTNNQFISATAFDPANIWISFVCIIWTTIYISVSSTTGTSTIWKIDISLDISVIANWTVAFSVPFFLGTTCLWFDWVHFWFLFGGVGNFNTVQRRTVTGVDPWAVTYSFVNANIAYYIWDNWTVFVTDQNLEKWLATTAWVNLLPDRYSAWIDQDRLVAVFNGKGYFYWHSTEQIAIQGFSF